MRKLLLLLAVLASCSAPVRHTSTATQPIVNGTVTSEYPGVIAFLGDRLLCTGTLIAPRVVLTAAHCIRKIGEEGDQVFFGTTVGGTGDLIDVLYVKPHPYYGAQLSSGSVSLSNDVALVLLAEDAPADPFPILQPGAETGLAGKDALIVGFGRRLADTTSSGIKREGIVQIMGIGGQVVIYRPNPALICSGDSGGPIFVTVDDTLHLLGVTSSGPIGCIDEGRSIVAHHFVDDFITPFVQATTPGAAKIGDRCFFPENCGEGTCTPSIGHPNISYCTKACDAASDCPRSMACLSEGDGSKLCRYPRGSPDVIGSRCGSEDSCETGICATSSQSGIRLCAVTCNPSDSPACPEGFECVASTGGATGHVCTPPYVPPAAGGCNAGSGPTSSQPLAPLLLLAAAVLVLLRRQGRVADATVEGKPPTTP